MLSLGLGLGIHKEKIVRYEIGRPPLARPPLELWLKFDTGQTVSTGSFLGATHKITQWNDQSGAGNNGTAGGSTIVFDNTHKAAVLQTVGKGVLGLASEISLTNFSIFLVLEHYGTTDTLGNPATASNEQITEGTNSELLLFPVVGTPQTNKIVFTANSTSSTINLNASYPLHTGSDGASKFILELIRDSSGALGARVFDTTGEIAAGAVSTSISDEFDIVRFGNGGTDIRLYEAVVYSSNFSLSNADFVIDDLTNRHF